LALDLPKTSVSRYRLRMNETMPADLSLDSLWAGSIGWIASHSVRLLVSALIAIALIASLYAIKLAGQRLSKGSNQWRAVIGRALASMRLWFMISLAAELIATYAHAPEDIALTLRFIFVIAVTFQAALFARELILGVVELRAGEADPSGSLSSAVGLIRLLVSASLFITAVILILSNLGVNVTGLVAGLGIGGIAIGLAAQGIFSDLFAALSILFDKPFRRGDAIKWEGTTGTVEYIGLKSTRIRAITGEEVVISNTNLLSKELRNLTRNERRRIIQPLSLVYHTPPAICAALPETLRAIVDGCADCHFVRCTLDNFAASSLDFLLVYDVNAEDQEHVVLGKHAVNLAILNAFAENGIVFAYPTQTTFTAAPDGKLVMPWVSPAGAPTKEID
jgi:small-conductance mechanosensitive channel